MTVSPPNLHNRVYAGAHFALVLDDQRTVGLFRSIEGGGVKADVMQYQYGAHHERWRLVGKPKFEDIKAQVGMAMSKPFYTWIEKFFSGAAERKSGAIIATDFYYVERARREFSEAMIRELTFPKLDASDKSAAYMTIAFAVEGIVFKRGDGAKLQQAEGMTSQKLWKVCNFRFVLDGVEAACKRVTKVDAFTIKQNVIEYHGGAMKAPIKTPGEIEFPNLTFYVPEADAQPFFELFKQRAIDGHARGHGAKRAGSIEIFDNDARQSTLFTVTFSEADIVSVQPDKSDAGSEEIKQVKIELSTERMSFAYSGG
ncbi:MAG: phage tail protein [Kofleriaceae bacterium]